MEMLPEAGLDQRDDTWRQQQQQLSSVSCISYPCLSGVPTVPCSSYHQLFNKFIVKFPLLRNDGNHIDRWVKFSAASRARRIVLDLCPQVVKISDRDQIYSFPLHFFSGNSCVKSLCLRFVSLNLQLPEETRFFKNLKKLTLHMVSITGDLQSFLPEIDVLEWLSLTFCSLRRRDLIIRRRLQKLELQAANLTEFEFANQQVPLVLVACINMSMASVGLLLPSDGFDYACTKLPVARAHVRDRLTVDMAIRTEAPVLMKGGSVFANPRHLILNVDIDGCPKCGTRVLRLACVLELAPVLEELE